MVTQFFIFDLSSSSIKNLFLSQVKPGLFEVRAMNRAELEFVEMLLFLLGTVFLSVVCSEVLEPWASEESVSLFRPSLTIH